MRQLGDAAPHLFGDRRQLADRASREVDRLAETDVDAAGTDEEAAARGLNYLYNVVPARHPDKAGLKRWLLRRGFVGAEDGELFKRTVQSRKHAS